MTPFFHFGWHRGLAEPAKTILRCSSSLLWINLCHDRHCRIILLPYADRMHLNNHLIRGGCLCAAIRYKLYQAPLQTTLCHCEDCRRASGAPAVAWTFCKTGTIEWTKGQPKQLTFAERERFFCGDCGTPLMFRDPSIPELFEVTTNSLDDPSSYVPIDQCWMDDALPWFGKLHSLKQYALTAPLPTLDSRS